MKKYLLETNRKLKKENKLLLRNIQKLTKESNNPQLREFLKSLQSKQQA